MLLAVWIVVATRIEEYSYSETCSYHKTSRVRFITTTLLFTVITTGSR